MSPNAYSHLRPTPERPQGHGPYESVGDHVWFCIRNGGRVFPSAPTVPITGNPPHPTLANDGEGVYGTILNHRVAPTPSMGFPCMTIGGRV